MSNRDAPNRWQELSGVAEACGAEDRAGRKWLERLSILARWKVAIVEHSNGQLSWTDLEFDPVQGRVSQ